MPNFELAPTMPSSDIECLALRDLDLCEERLAYRFRDRGLLEAALTHASGADHRLLSNERLEFFGDAILGLVVCEAVVPPVSRVSRRRSDQDQVDRRQPTDVCQDQRRRSDCASS